MHTQQELVKLYKPLFPKIKEFSNKLEITLNDYTFKIQILKPTTRSQANKNIVYR